MASAINWQTVCSKADLAETGSYGFWLGDGKWPLPGFVTSRNNRLFGYVNVCPHAGRPLNWKPHGFLTKDAQLILCTAHGALFEIETGLCVAGPCVGKSLGTVDVRLVNGQIQARYAG